MNLVNNSFNQISSLKAAASSQLGRALANYPKTREYASGAISLAIGTYTAHALNQLEQVFDIQVKPATPYGFVAQAGCISTLYWAGVSSIANSFVRQHLDEQCRRLIPNPINLTQQQINQLKRTMEELPSFQRESLTDLLLSLRLEDSSHALFFTPLIASVPHEERTEFARQIQELAGYIERHMDIDSLVTWCSRNLDLTEQANFIRQFYGNCFDQMNEEQVQNALRASIPPAIQQRDLRRRQQYLRFLQILEPEQALTRLDRKDNFMTPAWKKRLSGM